MPRTLASRIGATTFWSRCIVPRTLASRISIYAPIVKAVDIKM